MTWTKLDDNYSHHPKTIAAGGDGSLLFIGSLNYANRLLTDGIVPDDAVPTLTALLTPRRARRAASSLLRVGQWHDGRSAEDCPVPKCRELPRPGPAEYLIHEFHPYQESAEDVLRRRELSRTRQERFRQSRVTDHDDNALQDDPVTHPPTRPEDPGLEPGFAGSRSSGVGEPRSFEAEPDQKTIAKGLARAAAEAERNRTSEAAEMPRRIDFDDAAALVAQGREDVLDLAGLEEVLDPTKAHLLRTICRGNGAFLRLSVSHLAQLQGAGGPVLLEALQRIAYEPPADVVTSPAAYLDAVVADVRSEMQAREPAGNPAVKSVLPSPQTPSQTAEKGAS